MRNEMVTADHGPTFIGARIKTGDMVVCVVAPRASSDSPTREAMREIVRADGGNCGACQGCIVAKL